MSFEYEYKVKRPLFSVSVKKMARMRERAAVAKAAAKPESLGWLEAGVGLALAALMAGPWFKVLGLF